MLDALLELVARFLVDVLFYKSFYAIGWIMLRAITLGRYPPRQPAKHNEALVATFPILACFVTVTFAFW